MRDIANNETFVCTGDITVKSIGEDAKVTVVNGSLTVLENVGARADITVKQSVHNPSFGGTGNGDLDLRGNNVAISNMAFFTRPNGDSLISRRDVVHNIHIQGNVGKAAKILSAIGNVTVEGDVENEAEIIVQDGNVTARQNIGKHVTVKISDGNICGGNIGCNSEIIVTGKGDIVVGNVGASCSLTTRTGNINANNVERESTLTTEIGNVVVLNADSSVSLKTNEGYIENAGQRREKHEPVEEVASRQRIFVVEPREFEIDGVPFRFAHCDVRAPNGEIIFKIGEVDVTDRVIAALNQPRVLQQQSVSTFVPR